MLSRRLQRIKVLQALYAFFQSDNTEIQKAENELFLSLNRVYELYIYFLLLPIDVVGVASQKIEDYKQKILPTKEDLNPNLKFVNNRLISAIANNIQLKTFAENKKISWQLYDEEIRKFFNLIKQSDEYQIYMNSENNSFEEDRKILIDLYKILLPQFELIFDKFQEKSIYWNLEDIDYALMLCIKTFEACEKETQQLNVMPIYKDDEDDTAFIKNLFRKTILHNTENEVYISDKTKNWEIERIALIDIILMKMAITELLYFSSVPIKVTLNEYIEISKLYSSPNSKVFINGILDKLVADFKSKKIINKQGRGLIDK
ncbi:MAG: transcription antitermination protein NusB [Flavobacteriales bacterium]|nr:transcription antitermination protein NusB [Flavobacteriales bacterium]